MTQPWALFFDLDGDGDQDLFLLNDGGRNVLYENVGDGKFEDISEGSGLNIHCACMGVDFGDMDHDGDYDIYITNYGVNFLFENNGDGTFTDKGKHFDVDDYGMGWGTFWFDFDNDGDQDIYLANHEFISSRPNMLYQNEAAGSSFQHISSDSQIESPYASFGTASGDVNNDGLLDIVVANWGTTARNQLFVNINDNDNNMIMVKAVGTASNASAIGTSILVRIGDKLLMDQVTGATGYASQNSLIQHFGVGAVEAVDELIIKWPSGLEESYTDLPVNQYFTVTEDQGIESKEIGGRSVVASTEDDAPEVALSFPNPFSSSTFIPVDASYGESVKLEIYSTTGNRVQAMTDPENVNGQTGFRWYGTDADGKLLNGGIYLFKVGSETTGIVKTGKLMILR